MDTSTTPETANARRSRGARISTIVGIVVAVAGLAFVVHAIASQWHTVRYELAHARPLWLVLGVLTAGLAMLCMSLPWRRALAIVGARVDRLSTVCYYFAGEIGKYVPGGLWPIVGRGELARSATVPPATAYTSVLLSLGALYLGAMVFVVITLPALLVSGGGLDPLWVLALLPLGLAALHPRPLAWLVRVAERVTRKSLDVRIPPWKDSALLVACYLPCWLLVGTSTWCIARAFNGSVSWIDVAPAAVLSWIIGFVLFPIPGGIGVRESVFVALVGTLPSGVAATVAIVARLSFMLVDGIGALAAGAVLRVARRRESPGEARPADLAPIDELRQ